MKANIWAKTIARAVAAESISEYWVGSRTQKSEGAATPMQTNFTELKLLLKGNLDVEEMPLDLMSVRGQLANDLFATGADLRQAKAEFERHYILQTLEKHGWNQTEAAKSLGVHRNTLLTKMDLLHIRPTPASDVATSKAQDH